MFDYQNAASLAYRQIADKGRSITLRSVTQGTYNPDTDSFDGPNTQDVTLKGVFSAFKSDQIDGTIIQKHDKKVLIAGSNFRIDATGIVIDGSDNIVDGEYQIVDGASQVTPAINDIIIDGTNQYKIIAIEEVAPGGAVVLYRLHVRR